MANEQKIRGVLFYLSVLIFFSGLPFILSFALGYKFDTRTFKFSKTGLIVLETQPPGASVYLDNKLLNEKTPATVNELLPGNYNITLELEAHYPWKSQIGVEPRKVTRLDKIILFPLRPNIKQLNKEKISSFWLDKDKKRIYYIDQENSIIFKSDLEGDNFEEIGRIPQMSSFSKQCKVSRDKDKLLCFNLRQIAVVGLGLEKGATHIEPPFVLDYPDLRIANVFWHSDSYHLVLVTDRTIEVLEAKPDSLPVILVNLNKRNAFASYDDSDDSLYFLDSQRASDGRFYDNLYKLELNQKTSPIKESIKPKTNE
jgi:hypothetical protein